MPSEQEWEKEADDQAEFERTGVWPSIAGPPDDLTEPAFTDRPDPALPLWRWGGRRPCV